MDKADKAKTKLNQKQIENLIIQQYKEDYQRLEKRVKTIEDYLSGKPNVSLYQEGRPQGVKGQQPKGNEFRCEMCQGVFGLGWSPEEAKAEAEIHGMDIKHCKLVCDDCYKKTPWGNYYHNNLLGTI